MLTRIYNPQDDKERGFTLIELLVVVAIIGILAAIAIPVFLNQRNSARNASVKSDLNTVAQSMETYYTQKGSFPTATASWSSPPTSPGNIVSITLTNSNGAYQLRGCNAESNIGYVYDSAAGGMQNAEYTTTGCKGTAGTVKVPVLPGVATDAATSAAVNGTAAGTAW